MPFLSKLQVDNPGRGYPFSIPAIKALARGLEPHPKVTFLVGENGTGKSTLLEGLAGKWGFSKESGNRSKKLRQPLLRYGTCAGDDVDPEQRAPDGWFLPAGGEFFQLRDRDGRSGERTDLRLRIFFLRW
jgi:predicted ATPase